MPDGRTLVESNAILWYLAAGTPFLPADPFTQAEVCRWLIYEQSDVMFDIGGLVETLGIIDRHLATWSFLVGDVYSIADIADIAVFASAHVAEDAELDTVGVSALSGVARARPRAAGLH